MLRRKPTRVELGNDDKKDLEEVLREQGKVNDQVTPVRRTKYERIYGVEDQTPSPMDF